MSLLDLAIAVADGAMTPEHALYVIRRNKVSEEGDEITLRSVSDGSWYYLAELPQALTVAGYEVIDWQKEILKEPPDLSRPWCNCKYTVKGRKRK